MRSWKLLLPLLASTLALAAQPDRIVSPIDASQTVMLGRSLHPKAQPQYDQGSVEPSFQLSYVTLVTAPSPSQQKALDLLLAQQQDRQSPNYHKWLTPGQFADRFGLSQSDLNKVTAWLKSQGFKIISTAGGRNSIIFTGTAAQIRSAFSTEIHHYTVDGEQHIANSTPIMIPAALNGIVRSVAGLHDFGPYPASRVPAMAAMRNVRPDYFDGDFAFPNFLAPGDVATIYDIPASVDGTGQKIAVVGRTDILLSDINDFRNGFGLTPVPTGAGGCTTDAKGIVISPCNTTNFAYVLLGTDPHSLGADIGEADLDIEWSGAVAANAQIIFINGQTADNVNDSLRAAINPPAGPPLATVVSMSYGACELHAEDLESVLQQGNTEGVTVVNSSGDAGSATCDRSPTESRQPFATGAVGGLAVSYPASSPEVTGVGGTAISLANDSYPNPSAFWSTTIGANGGTAVSYIPETPWQDDEEWAQYCHAPIVGDTFCSTGGGTLGWLALPTNATAAQVQEDIWISQGGGGASNCFTENAGVCTGGFPQPSYQSTLHVPAPAPANVRYVPDVSLFASPNFPGYVFCTQGTCANGIFNAVDSLQSVVGGTSVSAPVFAGMVALLNQFLGQSGQGNLNLALYAVATTPGNNAFHPITTGDNKVSCKSGQPSAQPLALRCPTSGTLAIGFDASDADPATGYNLVTGLGSVDASVLFNALGAPAPSFTLAAAPTTITATAGHNSTTTNITITPQNGFTSSVTFSCTGLPSGASCSFSPPSDTVSTVLTVLTVPNMGPTVTVTVKGTAGSVSSTTPVTLNLNPTDETVTLATTPLNLTLTLSPGATSGNTANLTVGGTNGFLVSNGSGGQITVVPLTYTCTLTPAASEGPTCTVSSGVQAITATATVQTTPATVELRSPFARGSRIFYAMLLPGLFGIVFAAGSGKRGARLLSLIVVLGASTLWMGACGSSGGSSGGTKNPGTPPGTYTATVTANTSPASSVTASTTFTVVVQ